MPVTGHLLYVELCYHILKHMEHSDQERQVRPHVRIFGMDAQEKEKKGESVCAKGCRCERSCGHRCAHQCHGCCCQGGGVFGLAVLLGGALLLLNYAGLVSWEFWGTAALFWPILLVLAGMRMLLGRNWISASLVFILALAVFALIILYGLIQTNSPLVQGIDPGLAGFMQNIHPFN